MEYRPGSPAFATTHWSVVLAAAELDDTSARESLARLCHVYWFPLYAYVRRRGHSAEDAQDLTQEFFSRLLEKNWVAAADRSKGRFRTFLLTAMKHFLADEWDRQRAQKRGGGVSFVPLQLDTAEARYVKEPADPVTPERIFVSLVKLADGFCAYAVEHPSVPMRDLRSLAIAKALGFIGFWTIAWVPGLASIIAIPDAILFVLLYRGIVANANLVLSRQAAAAQ